MLRCVDEAEGLELWGDKDGYVVLFSGDRWSSGSSLLFAHHERQVFSGESQMEEDLDRYQREVVDLWFDEYEAAA